MSGAGPSLSLRIRALLLNAVSVSFRFSTVFRGFEIFNIYQSKSSDQVVFTERSQWAFSNLELVYLLGWSDRFMG